MVKTRVEYTARPYLHRRGLALGVVFVAAERTALIPLGNWVARQFGLRCECGVAVVLRTELRPVAETKCRFVVPEGSHIVRRAEENLVADVGVLKSDAHELDQVLRREPDRQPTPVGRLIGHVADAQAGDAQAVFE